MCYFIKAAKNHPCPSLRLDNTGAWVIEVNTLLLCNEEYENVDLYIKLKS